MRQGANEILVFVFTHFDFPNKTFYASKRYIHVTQEGEEDSLLAEDVIPTVRARSIDSLEFYQTNRADGEEANDALVLLSGRTSNLRSEDMVGLLRQGIAIDDDNDTAPENVPRL